MTTSPSSTVHYYAGYADGSAEDVSEGVTSVSVPLVKGARGPRSMYVHSAAWSAHFGRRTFVPKGHPGWPPRQTQAA